MESRWEVTEKALKKLIYKPGTAASLEVLSCTQNINVQSIYSAGLPECLLLFQDAINSYNQAHKKEWRFDALYSYVKVSDSIS